MSSTKFDPNSAAASDSGIFGLPFKESQCRVQILPVPWEVTTSYGQGTAQGPAAILEASHQVDLFDLGFTKSYEDGIFLHGIPDGMDKKSESLRMQVARRNSLDEDSAEAQKIETEINSASAELNRIVYEFAKTQLEVERIPAVLGGDHSTPYGLIQASSEHARGELGVLHVDAHADLRRAYQGYKHSHASIMYNVCESTQIKKLVQVGIRDFCEEEFNYIKERPSKIRTFFDAENFARLASGEPWQKIIDEVCTQLPQLVHISFDIDGLDPALCPNTGTPVPGGLSFQQAALLIETVARSGRKIVSFDLNEVSGKSEWDANVGARILYKLCGWAIRSNEKVSSAT